MGIPVFSEPNRTKKVVLYLKDVTWPLGIKYGIDWRALTGQAILETGWLRFCIKDKTHGDSYNIFGIKGTGPAGYVIVRTHEYDKKGNKYYVDDKFRMYNNLSECFEDYIKLIKNGYPQAWKVRHNYEAYVKALISGPRKYATDPEYANKVISIIRKYMPDK